MGTNKCVCISSPTKPIGERCDAKKARRSGMYCADCRDYNIRLLRPGSDIQIPVGWRPTVESMWERHVQVSKAEKVVKDRNNSTYRTINNGANKRAAQQRQNATRLGQRKTIRVARDSGDVNQLLAASRSTPTHQRRQALAIERGFDPNFDFVEFIADGFVQLLAAGSTDACLNHAQSTVVFGCKTAATRAAADLMIDYKRVNREIMQYSSGSHYDLDTAPSMSCRVRFTTRGIDQGPGQKRKFETKTETFLSNFAADNMETIQHLEDIAEELDELRAKVQAWYVTNLDCGVTQRYTETHCNVAYAPKAIVRAMVEATLSDPVLRDRFLEILDKADPDDDDQKRIKSILNGTFFFTTESTTAFHFCPDLLEFGFPSSQSTCCCLNRDLWNRLIDAAVRQGRLRRDILAVFILVWAAMDGSILGQHLEVIIADNAEMIAFFREIFDELHEGLAYTMYEYHAKSDDPNGKVSGCTQYRYIGFTKTCYSNL